ncbi:MAG: hypothetical protein GC180_04325 [Bacteroidetes bacterium]|nr:hypothetical protein [Bacteroidota bacterium]
MRNALFFDFQVDKTKNKVHVTRQFAADKSLVWQAWTKPELIDQWWAPKPYRTETHFMDFRPGGTWQYRMIGPENEEHKCCATYNQVKPEESFNGDDAFCLDNWEINQEFPQSNWQVNFYTEQEKTRVEVLLTYKKPEDLEMIISMGFKEGFSMALNNLDLYLESQFKLRKDYKPDNSSRVCTYLNFPGNTEEAFYFYQSVFKNAFAPGGISRFGDIPPSADQTPIADELKKMVLHIELPITANHILMGTDAPKEMGFDLKRGNNMHINIEPESRDEAQRIFNALAEGGEISMPLQDMFWGAYYGSLTDQFGINWMINYQEV